MWMWGGGDERKYYKPHFTFLGLSIQQLKLQQESTNEPSVLKSAGVLDQEPPSY